MQYYSDDFLHSSISLQLKFITILAAVLLSSEQLGSSLVSCICVSGLSLTALTVIANPTSE